MIWPSCTARPSQFRQTTCAKRSLYGVEIPTPRADNRNWLFASGAGIPAPLERPSPSIDQPQSLIFGLYDDAQVQIGPTVEGVQRNTDALATVLLDVTDYLRVA